MPMQPTVRDAIISTRTKITPCRLMESRNDPATLPKDWKMIVSSNIRPMQGVMMTCIRSISATSAAIAWFDVKTFIRGEAAAKRTAVSPKATPRMKRRQKWRSLESIALFPEPK